MFGVDSQRKQPALFAPPPRWNAFGSRMTVKSADRVLQILELFDDARAPMSVGEIAGRMGFPQSSTTELLQTLCERGYLSLDGATRKYAPTLLVSMLGCWRMASNERGTDLLDMIRELRHQTTCTITVGVPHAVHAKVICRVVGDQLPNVPGTLRPICRSAIGHALLSRLSDQEIGKLVRRINAAETNREARIELGNLIGRVREIRQRGYAVTNGDFAPSMGAVSVLLPIDGYHTPVAIAAGAPAPFVQENAVALVSALRQTIEGYSGLRMPS
ncbi:MAG: helix-turn-helix domain-containing protein [Reyranellaceae bacterium]